MNQRTKIIGLTGGIGSGKTTVARVFHSMGVPIFDADSIAKSLYDEEPEILNQIKSSLGEDLFDGEKLNKTRLGQMVFQDPRSLQKLNALVHPWVKLKFESWLREQSFAYVIREAAILLESGSYQDCDQIILVSAPEQLKMERVTKRSGLSLSEVKDRMNRQWTDDQRRPHCHHEIINDEKLLITPKIVSLHQYFMA